MSLENDKLALELQNLKAQASREERPAGYPGYRRERGGPIMRRDIEFQRILNNLESNDIVREYEWFVE